MARGVVGEDHPYAFFKMTMSTCRGCMPINESQTTAISGSLRLHLRQPRPPIIFHRGAAKGPGTPRSVRKGPFVK
jgi:hypothetical protein